MLGFGAGFGQACALPSPREGDGTSPHQPVRRGEQHVQMVKVLRDPAVAGLGEPEVAFDDQERVLDLGPDWTARGSSDFLPQSRIRVMNL